MVMLSHVLARCHCSTSIPTKRRSAQRKYTTITVMRTGSGWDGGVPFSCRMSLQHPILLIGGVPKVSTRPSGKYLIRWWCCPIFLPDVTAAPSIYSAEECLKQVTSTRPSWKCHLIRWLCRSIFLPAPQYLLSEGVAEESTRPSWKRHLIRWWWCPIFLPDVTAAPSIFSAEEWHSKFYSIPSWEVSTD